MLQINCNFIPTLILGQSQQFLLYMEITVDKKKWEKALYIANVFCYITVFYSCAKLRISSRSECTCMGARWSLTKFIDPRSNRYLEVNLPPPPPQFDFLMGYFMDDFSLQPFMYSTSLLLLLLEFFIQSVPIA